MAIQSLPRVSIDLPRGRNSFYIDWKHPILERSQMPWSATSISVAKIDPQVWSVSRKSGPQGTRWTPLLPAATYSPSAWPIAFYEVHTISCASTRERNSWPPGLIMARHVRSATGGSWTSSWILSRCSNTPCYPMESHRPMDLPVKLTMDITW